MHDRGEFGIFQSAAARRSTHAGSCRENIVRIPLQYSEITNAE